jgi:hypothetical protein
MNKTLHIKTSDGSAWELPLIIPANKVAADATVKANGRLNYPAYTAYLDELLADPSPAIIYNYTMLNWDSLRHMAVKVSGPLERIEEITINL